MAEHEQEEVLSIEAAAVDPGKDAAEVVVDVEAAAEPAGPTQNKGGHRVQMLDLFESPVPSVPAATKHEVQKAKQLPDAQATAYASGRSGPRREERIEFNEVLPTSQPCLPAAHEPTLHPHA